MSNIITAYDLVDQINELSTHNTATIFSSDPSEDESEILQTIISGAIPNRQITPLEQLVNSINPTEEDETDCDDYYKFDRATLTLGVQTSNTTTYFIVLTWIKQL